MDHPGWQSSFAPGPPAEGDDLSILWRADLGSNLRVGDLAAHLEDLHAAVGVGERWGGELARASVRQVLMNRVVDEGPAALMDTVLALGYRPRDLDTLEDWIHTGQWLWQENRFVYRDPGQLLETLADMQVLEELGSPMSLAQVQYRNPLELVLTGSGFLVAGTIYVLRLVRDWSNTRRIGAGAAREAEAVARASEARADLLRWLVDETRAGRMPVPPGDLLGTVAHSEAAALDRLATNDVTLQLPKGLDPSGGDWPGHSE